MAQSAEEAVAMKKKKGVTKSTSADDDVERTSMQNSLNSTEGAAQTADASAYSNGSDSKKMTKEKSARKLVKSESSSSTNRRQLKQQGSSRRLTRQGSSRRQLKDKKHPLKGAVEAMQGGTNAEQGETKADDKSFTDDNSSAKKKDKKKRRKKKKTTSSALTKLQDALDDLNPHVARSKDADKALRNIDKAVVQLEKQFKEWTENPPEPEEAKPEQFLNVRCMLTVDEPTPQLDPFDNMTLHRATYAANEPSEDRSTVVVGEDFVFAGVWDGHGGTSAAEFAQRHLFDYFQEAYESKGLSVPQSFQFAYTQTDRGYFDYARQINKPNVFFAGTCAVGCYVDIKTGKVTCANLGDSRAVMGLYKEDGGVRARPLSIDHSADNILEQTRIRQEHPHDRDILVNDGDKDDPDWRVKKLAAFTRSIGDLHLKEKNTAALFNSYVKPELRILPRPGLKDKQGVIKPKYISTEPDFQEATIKDGFIIIACDGVWDELSNEEAVNIVALLLSKHEPSERNIAELFIEETLKRAVRRISGTYEEEAKLTLAELKKRPPGKGEDTHRSYLHDDITVVILQFGKTAQRQAFGGSLFSMLQQADTQAPPSAQLSECDKSRMSRTKEKREMAARNSIAKYTEEIDKLQADAQRQATDRQIIEMMLAFEDLKPRHLRILFNAVDMDGNGTLDREEITRLIKNVIDMDVSDEVVDLAFSEMDVDGSGDVDFEEFVQFFGH